MRTCKKILAIAALAAFFVVLPKGFAEPRNSWSLENRVPASALGLISIEDVSSWEKRFEATAIAGLFREPEMQAFAAPIQEAITQLIESKQEEAGGMFGEATPMVMGLIKQLQGLRGQLAVAVLDVDMDAQMPIAAASFDFGPNVADFVTFLERVLSQMDPESNNFSKYEKDGRTWWQNKKGPPITATTVDTAFVVATDPTVLEGIVQGGGQLTLASDANFQAVRSKAGGDELGLFAYANVPAIAEMVTPMMGDEGAMISQVLGLDTIKGAAYGMAFSGDGFMDSLILHAPGADHGLVSLLTMEPYQARALKHVPANAFFYSEYAANFGDLLPNIRRMVTGIEPGMVRQMDDGLAQVNDMLGVDLEKDIIGGLAGGAATYAALPDTGGLYPEVAVMMQVKDAAQYEAVFKRMLTGLAGMVTEQGQVIMATRDLEYHGHTLHLVELQAARGDDVIPFTPTWVLLEDWLVVTLVPHAMKEIVLRQEAGANDGLAAQEDFQSLRRVMPAGAGEMEYIDLQAIMNLLYDTAVPLLQTAVKPNMLGGQVPFTLDWAQLPAARTARPYFRSMGIFVTWNKDGISLQMHGPLPLTGGMLVAGVAGALFFGTARQTSMTDSEIMREPLMPGGRPIPQPVATTAMQRAAAMQAKQISTYVEVFLLSENRLPTSLQELVTKDIAGSVPKDPWGKDYVLRILDQKTRRFQVVSPGPDGVVGTKDDITVGR